MSTEAFPKPTITKYSPEFKQEAYASLPTMELILFSVGILHTETSPVAIEEIVSTCFRLFPHSFALKNYFYWPDSALVARRLHDAKEKKWVKGSPTDGFELTGKGKQIAKQTAKALGVALPEAPKVVVEQERVKSEKVEVPAVKPIVKKAEPKVEKKKEQKRVTSKKAEVPAVKPVVKKAEPKVEKKEEQKRVTSKKVDIPAVKPDVKKVEPKVEKKQVTSKKVEVLVVKPVVKKAEPKAEKKRETSKKVEIPAVKPVVKKAEPKAEKKEKKRETSKKVDIPAVKPVVKKVEPKVEKKEEKKRVTSKKVEVPAVKPVVKKAKPKDKQETQPTQLTMSLTPPTAWKKAEVPATKPSVKEEAAQVVKGEVLTVAAVSKEEKEKAAKVIKQIERSDAYQLYKRNGRRAQIGEFDFRNMLFATMESSAETLKRNVELFKRYAGIHFRADLIAFLEFCEEHFAALLTVKVKGKK